MGAASLVVKDLTPRRDNRGRVLDLAAGAELVPICASDRSCDPDRGAVCLAHARPAAGRGCVARGLHGELHGGGGQDRFWPQPVRPFSGHEADRGWSPIRDAAAGGLDAAAAPARERRDAAGRGPGCASALAGRVSRHHPSRPGRQRLAVDRPARARGHRLRAGRGQHRRRADQPGFARPERDLAVGVG